MPKRALPVMKRCCPTCPFHAGGWTHVRGLLEERSMTATPICHSTGPEALKKGRSWIKQEHACRGARDLQLQLMFRLGVIKEPTDESWDEAYRNL